MSAAEAGAPRGRSPTVDDILAATICMRDGHANTGAVVEGYAQGATRARAVRIMTACPVTRDRARTATRSRASSPPRGRIPTEHRGVAPGRTVGRASLGEMAGVTLPVDPVRRPVVVHRARWPDLPAGHPFVIELQHRVLLPRRRAAALLFRDGRSRIRRRASRCRCDPTGWKVVGEGGRCDARRSCSTSVSAGGWTGFYETTPDHNGIIGESSDLPRVLLCHRPSPGTASCSVRQWAR